MRAATVLVHSKLNEQSAARTRVARQMTPTAAGSKMQGHSKRIAFQFLLNICLVREHGNWTCEAVDDDINSFGLKT